MSEKVLVIAAHPDDEVLGCGGTICKHTDNGDCVNVIIVSEGITSRESKRDKVLSGKLIDDLHNSSKNVATILGVENVYFLGLPDNRLDSIDRIELTKIFEDYISRIDPSIIYTHHCGDVNIDHRRIHESVITACRPTPNNHVKKILSFEILSSTEWQGPNSMPHFIPNWYIEINNQLDRKLKALNEYSSEMRNWPHSRSIEASKYLAKLRGSQVGLNAAEAFMLLRKIEE